MWQRAARLPRQLHVNVSMSAYFWACYCWLPVAGGQDSQGRGNVPQAVDHLVWLEQGHRCAALGSWASEDVDGCEGQARRRCVRSRVRADVTAADARRSAVRGENRHMEQPWDYNLIVNPEAAACCGERPSEEVCASPIRSSYFKSCRSIHVLFRRKAIWLTVEVYVFQVAEFTGQYHTVQILQIKVKVMHSKFYEVKVQKYWHHIGYYIHILYLTSHTISCSYSIDLLHILYYTSITSLY